ncbi:hypothetical protein IV203_004960 [Nitzschia inconspicua]|uniref:Uncharacterized protein n=1 Tax=Nitzschia inconspicua TaxID=303405 RepID=A0A9K3KLI8_9STRA|nr:hypothetical protein IV203_004960 [Nitzschia inconspicua]
MTPVLLSTFRPRTLIDMRVGKFHTVQLLVHIRQQDWRWYQENAVEITEEFQELMQERVLPRMVGTELEDFYRTKHPGVLPPLEEELGGNNNNNSSSKVVASKNNKLGGGGKKRETTSNKGRGKKGSKGGGGTVTSSTSKAIAKNSKKRKGYSLLQLLQDNKPEKDVYFSFGDIIQLSYRKEPALSYKTIFFQSQQDDPSKKKSTTTMNTTSFRDYHRLSHRLLIWISKLDPDQKTNPDPKGVGFYRPELIPISNLFRPPAELDLDDDDDDDNNHNIK